jgi:pyrimidine/purine-5'-nucleotide nucleosidase
MLPTLSRYRVEPTASFRELSRAEVSRLLDASSANLYELYRRCSLAVMSGGIEHDDAAHLLNLYHDFRITVCPEHRGVELQLENAPACAFVDGELIRGVHELLYAVLRDILFVDVQFNDSHPVGKPATEMVFAILRNAGVLRANHEPNMVVCWGGHAIGRGEYDYTKEVGYAFGLRGLDVCTGCGPGAMKGPMKGAHVGHTKQRLYAMRYVGVTEPGIIAAESPNPIVNELVIMPDIEKRLEAFVRVGHAFVVFPGGVGTAEEVLYLLGILCAEKNAETPFPLIFTGPESARAYFEQLDLFIGSVLGPAAQARYEIIINDPVAVAQTVKDGIATIKSFRTTQNDAWHFNWSLHIPEAYQQPFYPSHASMSALNLNSDAANGTLAADLRRAFSGIVAGNIKPDTIALIDKEGPFALNASASVMTALDALLHAFAEQGRMKLGDAGYEPCYQLRSR